MARVINATFTLDEFSLQRLDEAAAQLAMAQSEVVREAILEFHERLRGLSERERSRMLRAFDELVPKIPARDESETDRELAEVREARRSRSRHTRPSESA